MAGSNQGSWQLKRVISSTGPIGTHLSDAARKSESVSGQTEILWMSSDSSSGWTHDTAYRFYILHLPDEGLIHVKIYEGATLLHDSGDIIDNGMESLRGGRLGVYCDSQEGIKWSALSYKYKR